MAGALHHLRLPAESHTGGHPLLSAVFMRSLRTYLTYILVPIPEAQQQMGQHMDHIRLEEFPQHGAEHLEGKEGSWGREGRRAGAAWDNLPATCSPSRNTQGSCETEWLSHREQHPLLPLNRKGEGGSIQYFLALTARKAKSVSAKSVAESESPGHISKDQMEWVTHSCPCAAHTKTPALQRERKGQILP